MKTAWYKEPWAWLVVILPLSAVVAGLTTLYISLSDPDDLVVGDYYKKGKAINFEIKKVKLAQKLGMRFSIEEEGNQLVIKPTGIEKTFPLLNVTFYHPTLKEKDFYVALTPDGNGHFRHTFDETIKGKWKVTVTSFEDTWKIQNTLYFPLSGVQNLEPNVAESN